MKEEWKDIEGFEGLYHVSNIGEVKSLRRLKHNVPNAFVQEKILNIHKDGSVHLNKDGVACKVFVSKLVAKHFVPNPNNHQHVGYKNKNCMDFLSTNLEWIENPFQNPNDMFNIYGKHY